MMMLNSRLQRKKNAHEVKQNSSGARADELLPLAGKSQTVDGAVVPGRLFVPSG